MVTIELLGPLGNKSLTSKAKNFYELNKSYKKIRNTKMVTTLCNRP